ncbi:MAG: hypothetical protein KTR31_17300 [Myxococcales bacterium]|nr:hypothetical protein [Myxococcales bacterium]
MRSLSAAALLLAACSGQTTDTDTTTTETPADAVTFDQIGPIYEARCVACHQEGSIAPFRLDNYEDAKMWASASAAATASRSMPPFLVVGDGSCGDFEDSQWLTDEEIELISDWATDGALEGEGYDFTLPETPSLPGDAVRVSTPEFVPEIVGGAKAEFDEYRCFAADIPTDKDTFLTGYEVFPGNEAVVHHVIGLPVVMEDLGWDKKQTNAEIIAAMSDPERDGWPCFEGAGEGVSTGGEVVSWAPGQGAVEYPEGHGIRIPVGAKMVFQVHYNLVDEDTRGQSDQTFVDLRLEDEVDEEMYVTLPDLFLGGVDGVPESIPAGQADAEITYSMPMEWLVPGFLSPNIVGVLPHMHERGTQMSIALRHADKTETCVADVPNWDFNWQRIYMYDGPVPFSAADSLEVTCTYDTSGDTEPILPGWGTQNEMCLPGLLITIDGDLF